MTFDLYPFGFVVSTDPHDVPTVDFGQMALPGGVTYSFHRRSRGNVARDGKRFLIVHGHAVDASTGLSGQALAEELLTAAPDEESFLELLGTIGGRWAIVRGDGESMIIYPDAHGCRSIYYADDRPLAASHAHLAQRIRSGRHDAPAAAYSKLSTQIWDRTPYDGIRALLPNHCLHMNSRTVTRFWPRDSNRFTRASRDERVGIVESAWHTQMAHYASTWPGLLLSLTGGADSRVVLAMSRRHLPNIDLFTYTTHSDTDDYWSRTVRQDARIVEEITSQLGISSRSIDVTERQVLPPEVRQTIRANTLGAHGTFLLPYYRQHFGQDRLHVRGNLLETGRSALLAGNPPASPEPVRAILMKSTEGDAQVAEQIDEGLERFGYSGDLHGYHPVDLFYMEVRMGRWYSELLNETDSVFDSFMPFNVRAMVESALAWPLRERVQGSLFYELINRNFPVLNFFGRNEARNLYELARDAGLLPTSNPSGG